MTNYQELTRRAGKSETVAYMIRSQYRIQSYINYLTKKKSTTWAKFRKKQRAIAKLLALKQFHYA
jgi:hypothetical protein